MVSLRSTLVPRLSVMFTIRENFRKFLPSTKFTTPGVMFPILDATRLPVPTTLLLLVGYYN